MVALAVASSSPAGLRCQAPRVGRLAAAGGRIAHGTASQAGIQFHLLDERVALGERHSERDGGVDDEHLVRRIQQGEHHRKLRGVWQETWVWEQRAARDG